LQLPERPFVGIGDEGYLVRLKDRAGVGGGGVLQPYRTVRHEQTVARQLLIQPRPNEGLEMLSECVVDLPVESAVPDVDEAAGIAKRPLDGLPIHWRRRGISIRKKDLKTSRTRETMANTERILAARNCSTKLPVVGSMYIFVPCLMWVPGDYQGNAKVTNVYPPVRETGHTDLL
jgi:hypothetical protein